MLRRAAAARMFRTKKDVDKHVQDINSKIKSSSERNMKGYSIAKLYFAVEDFENARRYLGSYLLEKDTSAVAHKLNGQILEKLKQPAQALESYKRAHELEASMDLVVRICTLMAALPLEPGRAKYWVEVGERAAPHHEAVYRLRQALLTASEGEASPALEAALLQEVAARPGELQLHLRLVSLYQRTGRAAQGFQHCAELEQRRPWPGSRDWAACLVEICENYKIQFPSKCDCKFYTLYLSSLARLVELQARQGATASLLADLLHRLDQNLEQFGGVEPAPPRPLLSHFRSQLYLGCAVLLTKRALKDPSSWREGARLAGLLYLAAWAGDVAPECAAQGAVRRVVAAHLVTQLAAGETDWVERVSGLSNAGERVHKAVFVTRDQRDKMASSCLASQTSLCPAPSIPSLAEIARHCPAFVTEYRTDLGAALNIKAFFSLNLRTSLTWLFPTFLLRF